MSGMKTSTIKKLLSDRIETWLKSITDERVQKLARDNTIISGGAIASALAGDKINDYDIYFRNKETALAIANHYCALFNSQNGNKLSPNGTTCSPVVKEMQIKNSKGNMEDRVVIYMKSSGVASETQTEYKYFESRPEDETDEFVSSLANEESVDAFDGATEMETVASAVEKLAPSVNKAPYRPVFLSDNAITLSGKIQLVIRFYGEPSQIHENYDYAHAMCYYTHWDHKLVCPPEALECILSKTLVYKGSLYPIASIFRVRKFIERGWRITAGQMLKIMFQISKLDLESPTVLRDQLLGVDQAYMHQLIRAIENKESTQRVDATYLAKLIDEIFE